MNNPIVHAYYQMPTVIFKPTLIKLDQSVEDMVSGFKDTDERIITENFPSSPERSALPVLVDDLMLVQPLRYRQIEDHRRILELLDYRGYIPQGLPHLAALKESWPWFLEKEIEHIFSFDFPDWMLSLEESRAAVQLSITKTQIGFTPHWLNRSFSHDAWFVVRPKPTE